MSELSGTVKALKPNLRRYLEEAGVKFKSPYVCHCPFKADHKHGDADASAGLYANGEQFNCFKCGKKGDIIDVCMELENVSFHEAVKKLCDQFGIPNDIRLEKTVRLDILEEVCDFISRKGGTQIATARGMPINVCRSYGIGSVGYKKVEDIGMKYSEEERIKSGLWRRIPDGRVELLPLVGKDILTFVLRDINGAAVGVCGRRNAKPKYLDPAGNKFHNKDVPYPINRAVNHIRNKRECILVEGYMDALQMHIHEHRNVVAIKGRAPTSAQLQLIESLGVYHITLMMDNDDIGRDTTMEVLHKHYIGNLFPLIRYRVLEYSDKYKDPDKMFCDADAEPKKCMQKTDGLLYMIKNIPRHFECEVDTIDKLTTAAADHSGGSIQIGIYSKAIADTLSADYIDVRRDVYSKWLKSNWT